MKENNFYKYILLFLTIIFLSSCEDNDTSLPEIVADEVTIENEVTLDSFIRLTLSTEANSQGIIDLNASPAPTEEEITNAIGIVMAQIQNGQLTISLTNTSNISGYVISSDQAGNFFEELIIQDKPENPTIGVKIMINVNPLHTTYEIGRKVYLNVSGLFLGINNGVLAIGATPEVDGGGENEVSKINSNILSSILFRTTEVSNIVPLEIVITDLNDANENLFIKLKNVQFFIDSFFDGVPATFASENNDRFNGDRMIVSCDTDENRVQLSTGTFATFKSQNIPKGVGAINAILARDFFNDKYILKINDASDINFSDDMSDRCGFEFFSCNTSLGSGTDVLFQENFEGFSSFTNEGWTNVNIRGGQTKWEIDSFQSNSFASVSAFNSGESLIDSWLVTPTINMDNTTDEKLDLDIQTNFDSGRLLLILISNDFVDNVLMANWEVLEIKAPRGANGFGNFQPITTTNLSCIDGDVNIAFLYLAADPGLTTGYNIDEIKITGINN